MPHGERTITITRSPDDVFAFFTDPANDPIWRKGVKEMAASGPIAVGSTVHQVVAGPGGRSIAADIRVTAFDPPKRYAFETTAGPARPTGEYVFTPSGSGTDVRFSLSADLGGLKKLFMSKPVQSTMDAEMQALDAAKAKLEGG
jgi:carbon monoxide dehydrogenase subunit G